MKDYEAEIRKGKRRERAAEPCPDLLECEDWGAEDAELGQKSANGFDSTEKPGGQTIWPEWNPGQAN